MPYIPNGFVELVELVNTDYPLPSVEKVTESELWDNFCYCALFGPDRIEAETSYVHDLLKKKGLLSRKNLREDGWISRTEAVLKNELKQVKEPAKDRKTTIIRKVLSRIRNLYETLMKADEVFTNLDIAPNTLKKAENDRTIGEILASLVYAGEARPNPNKILDVGYTKAVLWLHSCGVGKDYAPDNNHTIRFLNECGYGASVWRVDATVRKDYDVLMSYLKKVTYEVNEKLGGNYSVADVSHAIFYYMSTKSLIDSRKYKKYYDPATMLLFLNKKSWGIDDLANTLFNIHEVDALREELIGFISGTFRVD